MDIPEPKPEVTEYQLHCLRCSCGRENWAKIPQTARSGFGPRLTALLAHLTGLHRVTRRGCQEIAKTIFGIDICLGSVCKLHQEVSESLALANEAVREALPEQPVLNSDETGWNKQGERSWLWIVVTPLMAYYHLAASPGQMSSRRSSETSTRVFSVRTCTRPTKRFTMVSGNSAGPILSEASRASSMPAEALTP
jgi:hypothetical protein